MHDHYPHPLADRQLPRKDGVVTEQIVIVTEDGPVTSFREAWKDTQGRSVITWRCDEGQSPHDFGSVEAAEEWAEGIWWSAPQKERDTAGWKIIGVPQ